MTSGQRFRRFNTGRLFYIQHNGFHWLGEEPDDVAILLDVLASYRLDP